MNSFILVIDERDVGLEVPICDGTKFFERGPTIDSARDVRGGSLFLCPMGYDLSVRAGLSKVSVKCKCYLIMAFDIDSLVSCAACQHVLLREGGSTTKRATSPRFWSK